MSKGKKSLQAYLQGLSLDGYIRLFGSVFNRETHRTVRFKLWPKQLKLARLLNTSKITLIPKARQLGISEIAGEEAVKYALQYSRALILIFSKTDRDAQEFLETKIKPKIQALPKIKGIEWPRIMGESQKHVRLSNGSRIVSLPASNRAGASMVADMIIFDEAGGIDLNPGVSFATMYRNVKPVIEKAGEKGRMRIIGTSEAGSHYNEMVKDVRDGVKTLDCFFLPADADPNRTMEWLAHERQNYPSDVDFLSQYPMTLSDFFIVREGLIFPHFDPTEGGEHVMDFGVDGSMPLYYVYDHGYRHPSVYLEAYHDPRTDTLYINNEWYWNDTRAEIIAEDIKEIENKIARRPYKRIADSAIFAQTGTMGVSEIFRRRKLEFTKSNKYGGKAIMDGSGAILSERFTHNRIVIHPRCVNLIQELSTWRWDEKKKVDTPVDIGDDGIDCVRYICAELDTPAPDRKPVEKARGYRTKMKPRAKKGSRQWQTL